MKHEWIRDEQEPTEGLICDRCGVTEAEMEAANGQLDECRGD
jgi:hypothetical protein